ncbi:hypothetical protein V6Z79_002881 [Aspergillus fumigatus]
MKHHQPLPLLDQRRQGRPRIHCQRLGAPLGHKRIVPQPGPRKGLVEARHGHIIPVGQEQGHDLVRVRIQPPLHGLQERLQGPRVLEQTGGMA